MKIHTAKDVNGNTCRFYVANDGRSAIGPRTWIAYQLFRGRGPLALAARSTPRESISAARAYLATKRHPFPENLSL